jgi:hypothetical protein
MLLLAIPRLRIRGLLVVFLRSDECPESETLLDMIIFIGSRCQHSFLNPAATSTLDGLKSSRALQGSHEEIGIIFLEATFHGCSIKVSVKASNRTHVNL